MPNRAEGWVGKLAYEAATRSLDQQRTSIDELRTRTGTLLGAANIATAFLAGVAKRGTGEVFPHEFLWAVIPFVVAVGLCIAILWPTKSWVFSLRPSNILDRAVSEEQSLDELQTELAGGLDEVIDKNAKRVNKRFILFGVSAFALLWEVVAWVVIIV